MSAMRGLARAAIGWLAAGLLAAGVLGGTTASAQEPRAAKPANACPTSGTEMPTDMLFGDWDARIDGHPGVGKVHLAKHPDYDGVRGTITRGGDGTPAVVAQLAGDIDDDGMLNLDESLDGKAISGVWLGSLQPDACGKQFKGNWRDAGDASTHSFTLDKTGTPGTAP